MKSIKSTRKNILPFISRLAWIATWVVFVMLVSPAPAPAKEGSASPSEGLTAEEAARELANPNTPLASLTLKTQYWGYAGNLPDAKGQGNLGFVFQPAFPFPIARTQTAEGPVLDQIFLRPAFPVFVDKPVFSAARGRFDKVSGMGDIAFDLAWGRNYLSGLLLAGGVVSSLPTGKDGLTSGTWTAGPEVFVGKFYKWGVLALFPNHQWNIGGPDDRTTSITSIQPAAIFLLGGGWSVGSAGILSYDWQSNQWTVPLQMQVSKTVLIGGTPWKFALEANYYVEHADSFGPEWMIGFNITPVVPNIFADLLK